MAEWAFDAFIVDEQRRQLRHGGQLIPLEPQEVHVLVTLVRHHRRVVPKNELLDTVWHSRWVSDTTVTTRIKTLRRALGDDGLAQRYIRTVRCRGYRFVGDVRLLEPSA